MNAIVAWILKSVLSFLGKELINILKDKRLQSLAVKAVENATNLDLDNDGKRKNAIEELKAEATAIGKELADRQAGLMIEAALNKLKSLQK
jgi:hypothetical protein